MKSWLIRHSSNRVFQTVVSVASFGHTQIQRENEDWLISKDSLTLVSPTPKFIGFGMTLFKSKFEQYFKIDEGDTCIDVGACIGDTAIPMALKTGGKGKVYAIEPHPTNVAYLQRNTACYPQIEIIAKGVCNRKGVAPLFLHDFPTGYSLHKHSDHHNSDIQVEVDTLDNLFHNKHVDYAKIDGQGSEVQILEGALKFMESCPKIVVGTHFPHTQEYTSPKILAILKASGYTTKINEFGNIYGQKS